MYTYIYIFAIEFHAALPWPVERVIWLDCPSYAQIFFHFYLGAKNIYLFVKAAFDWPVINGLILMYHEVLT